MDIVQFDLGKRNSILRYFDLVRARIIVCIVLQHYFVEVLCLAEIYEDIMPGGLCLGCSPPR